MKPAPFDYWRPDTIEQALDLLGHLGDDAKVLAGGQSLVPMMNLRLARPAALVDLAALAGLDRITAGSGTVEIGALVRHLDLERTTVPGPLGGLLRCTARRIGHLPIRVRGTFGGSVAHADPAAEWCLIARTLDAEIVVRNRAEKRTVHASEFFRGYFTTTLQPDEVVVAVRMPALGEGHEVGFSEFSRRAGDFAIVAAATVIEVVGGRIASARVGLAGVADRPLRSAAAEAVLVGERPSAQLFAAAAEKGARAIDPPSDAQATTDDRRDLARVLVRRALERGQTAS